MADCCPTFNSTPCLFANIEQTVTEDDIEVVVIAGTIYAPSAVAANCIALEFANIELAQAVCDLPPTADPQTLETNFNTPLAITLTGSSPSGGTLIFLVQTNPTNGSLSGTGANLVYTPFFGYDGPDSFTFTVLSGEEESAPATVTITVLEEFVANDAEFIVPFETPTAIVISGTGPVDPLIYTITDPPDHGTLTGTAPNLTYTPDPGYDGPDSFQFTVGDGITSSTPATVSITVLAEEEFLADYIVIQYAFTDGLDLDTHSIITAPEMGVAVGWCKSSHCFLTGGLWYEWSGDNTGVGFESVLIYVNTIRDAYPLSTILGDCKAWWYNVRESGDVTLRLTAYVGGTMEFVPGEFRWVNVGGSESATREITTNVVLNQGLCQPTPDCVSGWSYDIANSEFQWTSCT